MLIFKNYSFFNGSWHWNLQKNKYTVVYSKTLAIQHGTFMFATHFQLFLQLKQAYNEVTGTGNFASLQA